MIAAGHTITGIRYRRGCTMRRFLRRCIETVVTDTNGIAFGIHTCAVSVTIYAIAGVGIQFAGHRIAAIVIARFTEASCRIIGFKRANTMTAAGFTRTRINL